MSATSVKSISAVLDVKAPKVNSIQFAERKSAVTSMPILPTVYVPHTTLMQLGFQPGQAIKVTIELA
jgi:hypothetical protein